MADQVLVEAMSKKSMKSYISNVLVLSTRELSRYVANDGTIFHHTDSMSVMTILLFSLSRVSCSSRTECSNVLVHVVSSNDTLHNKLFHRDLDKLI